jgi:hypothetical protein
MADAGGGKPIDVACFLRNKAKRSVVEGLLRDGHIGYLVKKMRQVGVIVIIIIIIIIIIAIVTSIIIIIIIIITLLPEGQGQALRRRVPPPRWAHWIPRQEATGGEIGCYHHHHHHHQDHHQRLFSFDSFGLRLTQSFMDVGASGGAVGDERGRPGASESGKALRFSRFLMLSCQDCGGDLIWPH